jgi:hypothetical protein
LHLQVAFVHIWTFLKPIDFTRDHLELVSAAVAEWELLEVHRREVASLARPGDLVLVILSNEE